MNLNKILFLALLIGSPGIVWGNGITLQTGEQWPADDGSELTWGRKAVGGTTITDNPPVVYVIDGGVGYHTELPNVERFAVNSVSNNVSLVGCYPHPTHVAGIIAAAKNGTGVAGVAAGAKIVSISVALRNMPGSTCGDNTPEVDPATGNHLSEPYNKDSLLAAFTKVREHSQTRWAQGDHRIAIVNLSLNSTDFALPEVRAAMLGLTIPGDNYAGAFIVQSAGNYFNQTWMNPLTCQVAYAYPALDGIMVIGAVNRNGNYPTTFDFFGSTISGGNVRECVEAYAPGDKIRSTYGYPAAFSRAPTSPSTWQPADPYDPLNPLSYIAELSGTSMAAPHVAGIAAGLLRDNPSLTPIQMESRLRSMLYEGPTDPLHAPDGLTWSKGLFNSCLSETVPPTTVSDSDGDGVPDYVECAEGLVATTKDNDVFSKNRLFVMQQYRDFLGREGDAAGIINWTAQAGTLSRAQVIEQGFFASSDFQGIIAPVARLYFAYFLRVPDYSGFLFWVSYYRAGNSLLAISNYFAQSPEFQSTYGSLNNGQFVNLVYQNVLGRAADSSGYAFWTGQLDAGTWTRGQLMSYFADSPEYQGIIGNEVYVTMAYIGMVRRSPDPGGFSFWVSYLDQGNSGQSLLNAFYGSAEYHQRFLP